MRNQFLSVNIGLPRRFPTVLTLNRYNLNSYWLIFKSFISKYFLTELVKTQHRACFELLNLMFNYQCQPNPQIELSQNWKELWQDSNNNITNLRIKLKINENVSIPLLQLANFNNKINDSDYTVTSNDVEVLPYTTFFGNNNVNIVTTTFIKAFIMFHFTQILNGDFFRTQADTLNKFQFIMFEDKILDPSKLYKESDNDDLSKKNDWKYNWIEHSYFKLFFTKNPNITKGVRNLDFEFLTPEKNIITQANEPKLGGGTNKPNRKRTIKKNKQNKRNKSHKRVGGSKNGNKSVTEAEKEAVYKEKEKQEEEALKQWNEEKARKDREDRFQSAQSVASELKPEDIEGNIGSLSDEDEYHAKAADDKRSEAEARFQSAQRVASELNKEDIEGSMGSEEEYYAEEAARKAHESQVKAQVKEQEAPLDASMKDLVFHISNQFDIFDNTLDLVDEIIKLNTRSLDGDDKKIKIDEFTKLFEPFSIKFKNFGENGVKPNDQTFVYFVYTYILLYCYKTAFIESQKTANIFSFDDWWFFSSNQFDNIKKELNFQIILNKFNELVNIEPSAFPPSSQESVEPVNNSPPPSVEPVSNSDVPSDVASAVPSVEPVNNSPPPSNETPAETPSAETPNELGNNL